MNVKKLISIFLLIATFVILFAACNNGGNGDNTTSSPEEQTTPEQSSEATTTARPDYSKLEYTGKAVVKNSDLGMRVAKCVNSNPYVCDAEITKKSISLSCYTPGIATLELEDYFGHKAKITVEVKKSSDEEGEDKNKLINTVIEKCKEDFIEVADFGAIGDGKTDDTKAFQLAVNYAKPGETVYVYPGRYEVYFLNIKEGVTLRMYTEMTDAKEGYTEEIAEAVNENRYTILSNTRIVNNELQQSGVNGSSNFSIIGGVLDINQNNKSTLIFGCANNIRLENIIFKDMKNNHVIQLTGTSNAVIENCMFAGFVCGENFTRETIQIEPSTPGANGNILNFADGNYICPKNITINNCYFGKSDEAGPPLIAIGHHGQVGEANVTGLKITNNVFDEVLYAGIRYHNLVDAEITGNTFISTSKYKNATQFSDAKTPAFIILYHTSSATEYNSSNGTKITRAASSEQAGHHNVKIENNTFNVGKGSDKRIFEYSSATFGPGATYLNVKRQDEYNSAVYAFNGYSVNKNYAENISFSNNTINFEGQPSYKNYYINAWKILDFKFENNKINLAEGVDFSVNLSGFEKGQNLKNHKSNDAYTYEINIQKTNKIITIIFGEKRYTVKSNSDSYLHLRKQAGGNIKFSTDEKGNLTVTVNPAEGYKCDRITDSSNKELPFEITLNSGTVWNITFIKN